MVDNYFKNYEIKQMKLSINYLHQNHQYTMLKSNNFKICKCTMIHVYKFYKIYYIILYFTCFKILFKNLNFLNIFIIIIKDGGCVGGDTLV